MNMEKAILAGGCFWGMEELIRAQKGVVSTVVGYTGGQAPHPTYEAHAGHAEALEITFDADVLSYRKLLEFFFQIHDPTTLNRQGNDVGTSYRSAIFYLSPEQEKSARALIHDLTHAHIWSKPIVTEVAAAQDFHKAEDYHQNYLQKHPNGYTCHYVRSEWKTPNT